jgi:hypothetical protein
MVEWVTKCSKNRFRTNDLVNNELLNSYKRRPIDKNVGGYCLVLWETYH